MATHKWLLQVTDKARKQIRKSSSSDRMAIFGSIAELLESENPKAASDVKKLWGPLEGQWRKRQGKYRIFFTLQPGEIVQDKFTYKGALTVEAVADRKEAY